MNEKSRAVVARVMGVWREAAKPLSPQEYVEAAEEIIDYLAAAAEAAKEELEEE